MQCGNLKRRCGGDNEEVEEAMKEGKRHCRRGIGNGATGRKEEKDTMKEVEGEKDGRNIGRKKRGRQIEKRRILLGPRDSR